MLNLGLQNLMSQAGGQNPGMQSMQSLLGGLGGPSASGQAGANGLDLQGLLGQVGIGQADGKTAVAGNSLGGLDFQSLLGQATNQIQALQGALEKQAGYEKNDPRHFNLQGLGGSGNPGETFSQIGGMVKDHLGKVSELESNASNLARSYALGENVPLHQVMIASEKAGIAMELTMQLRNKFIQAYQDVMHMPL